MITITFFQNREGKQLGFSSLGHAGYADAGLDIVCAGVSALVTNTINSIDELTSAEFDLETEQETGEIRFSLHRPASDDADLLIQSLILGLKGIQKDYGDEYLVLDFKEV